MAASVKDDVLLVLGCGINSDGTLTEDALESARMASDIWSQGVTAQVIASGSVSYKANFMPPVSEAQAVKDHAVSLGVPSDRILTEAESKDTLGNAVFARLNLLDPLGLRKVRILPGPNHSQERLEYLFRKVFGSDIEYSFVRRERDRPQEQAREQQSLIILKGLLDGIEDGDVRSVYRIMRQKHPGYSRNPDA